MGSFFTGRTSLRRVVSACSSCGRCASRKGGANYFASAAGSGKVELRLCVIRLFVTVTFFKVF
jgi:hypothetical protein